MSLIAALKNSKALRAPLLTVSHWLLSILKTGPGLLRRAAYDTMPIPYLVAGHKELFIVATADKVIGRELFLHGEFDFNKLQAALAVLAREGIETPQHLIDVGANIGTIVIPALKRGLFSSATAIEPHPDNLRLLRANLALNGVDGLVTILPQAVGDKSAVQLFLQESDTNSGNHSISSQGIPIFSSQLDDLSFPSQSLLWMDIEGYEGHALCGAAYLLKSGMPLVSEFNPEFLTNSGGMKAFQQALSEHLIYDLQYEDSLPTSLECITTKLNLREKHLQWTDILAIPKPTLQTT